MYSLILTISYLLSGSSDHLFYKVQKLAHSKDAFSFSDQYTEVGTQATRLPSNVGEVPSFTEVHDTRAVDLSQE